MFCVERTIKYSSTASGAEPRPLNRTNVPAATAQIAMPATNATGVSVGLASRSSRFNMVMRAVGAIECGNSIRELNHALDLIIFDALRVRKDNQLPKQTQGKQLQAEHDEE